MFLVKLNILSTKHFEVDMLPLVLNMTITYSGSDHDSILSMMTVTADY